MGGIVIIIFRGYKLVNRGGGNNAEKPSNAHAPLCIHYTDKDFECSPLNREDSQLASF